MRASSAVMLIALPALAVADLHKTFVCINRPGRDVSQYNAGATAAACSAYRNRNTGNNQWDKCPDCNLRKDTGELSYCESNGFHLGGDEIYFYCRKFGSTDSIAWN